MIVISSLIIFLTTLVAFLGVDGSNALSAVCNEDEFEDAGVCVPLQCPEYKLEHKSIKNYLNPVQFEDPDALQDIKELLQSGELVVIRDAFLPEFAEALHCDLATTKAFKKYVMYYENGFHFSHHNIYDVQDFSLLMNDTVAMFDHPESRSFIEELTQRDCSGNLSVSASHYMPGDHSLPHTDQLHQRTVAYVWHLAKKWQPKWGGALYWAPTNEYIHASFNTLSLFSIHPDNTHFVTTVSKHASEKRLCFNGWYTSSWVPSLDDALEEMIDTEETRWDLTFSQVDKLRELVKVENEKMSTDRRKDLLDLMAKVENELWSPHKTQILEIQNGHARERSGV